MVRPIIQKGIENSAKITLPCDAPQVQRQINPTQKITKNSCGRSDAVIPFFGRKMYM